MKNTILSILCLTTFFGFSQMTLKKLDGTPINNGDLLSFSTLEDPDNYLGIKVYNSATTAINVRIKCENITNADGSEVQLCFGDVCVGTIAAGNSYPNNPSIIPANGVNGDFDHFLNLNPGTDPNANVEYVFRFYQVDNGIEIGNSITFTYRYIAPLSTTNFNSLQSVGVLLKSTIIQNLLEITTLQNVQMIVYDLNGNQIKNQNLNSGDYSIDVSNLSSGVYILSFKNEEGQNISKKIIKK
jgi:Secretion system C-terminal sorting domain